MLMTALFDCPEPSAISAILKALSRRRLTDTLTTSLDLRPAPSRLPPLVSFLFSIICAIFAKPRNQGGCGSAPGLVHQISIVILMKKILKVNFKIDIPFQNFWVFFPVFQAPWLFLSTVQRYKIFLNYKFFFKIFLCLFCVF